MNHCSFFQINSLLGKKWTYAVLQKVAGHRNQRFNDLSKSIPTISPKILAEKLSKLQENGLICKEQGNTITEAEWTAYKLTTKGNELLALYDILKEWSNKYSENNVDCTTTNCADCNLHF